MTWFTVQSVAMGSLTDPGLASALPQLRVPGSTPCLSTPQPDCTDSHWDTQAILGEREQTGVLAGRGSILEVGPGKS